MSTSLKEAFSVAEAICRASPASRSALAAFGTLRRVRQGEHVFRDRDEVSTVCFLIRGVVALYKISSPGEKRVIFVLGPGEMVNGDALDERPASVNCEATEDSLLLCFDRILFCEVMARDFELTKAVIDSISKRVRRLVRQLKNASGSTRLDKRIAAKLWKLSNDHGVACEEGIRIGIRLSVTALAEMLGAKRETVSRQLKVLVEHGLVVVRRNDFIVPDRDALARYFKE